MPRLLNRTVVILAFAQSSDFAQNLEACKNGRGACDRSKLTESESAGVALADHQRNIANCRDRFEPCVHSKLTEPEAIALALADHQRNISNCNDGMGSCDRSKLSQSEAREMAVADHQRNLSACKDGQKTRDYSKLTRQKLGHWPPPTASEITQHVSRGQGYCDRSRLTPSEARAIPAQYNPIPQ